MSEMGLTGLKSSCQLQCIPSQNVIGVMLCSSQGVTSMSICLRLVMLISNTWSRSGPFFALYNYWVGFFFCLIISKQSMRRHFQTLKYAVPHHNCPVDLVPIDDSCLKQSLWLRLQNYDVPTSILPLRSPAAIDILL